MVENGLIEIEGSRHMLSNTIPPEELAPGSPLTFHSGMCEVVGYTARCIPAKDASTGAINTWSLTQLSEPAFIERLGSALPRALKKSVFYAPAVDAMSAVVLDQELITHEFPIDDMRTVVRPEYQPGGKTRIACDGVPLHRGDSFIMSAGGCPLLILTGYDASGAAFCITAHAGRNSLIDMRIVRGLPRTRNSMSIVDSMVAYVKAKHGPNVRGLVMRCFFSLPWERYPHSMDDPTYGVANNNLRTHLLSAGMFGALLQKDGNHHLSLPTLVRLQAARHDMAVFTHGFDLPVQGDFGYTTHPDPALRGARNLVVVHRHR